MTHCQAAQSAEPTIPLRISPQSATMPARTTRMAPDPHQSAPDPAESLRQLSARAAAGDERAYAELHRRLAPALVRFLLRRTGDDRDLAEDLAQRAWIGVWEALRDGRYDPQRSAFTTFLYGVAYKTWLQHARTSGRRPVAGESVDVLAERLFSDQSDPVEFLRTCELLDAIRGCLAGAPGHPPITAEERMILKAVASGATEREMARDLGVAPSTLNSRKQIVFSKLRSRIGQYWESRDAEQDGTVGKEPDRGSREPRKAVKPC